MKRKLLSIFLVLTMMLTMATSLSITASAETANNVKYIDASGTEQTCPNANVVGGDVATWIDGWYIVKGTVTINTTVDVEGNVNLILADGCALKVTAEAESAKAGIHVASGSSLTIYGQEKGTGKLTATGAKFGAGIGGGSKETGNNISINGGTVTAKGGAYGAGIGGGQNSDGKNITINGGTVTATCSSGNNGGGAGIGGGGSSTTSGSGKGIDITINGGTIKSTGGRNAAGIGGGGSTKGTGGAAESVSVNGGVVTATGGENGIGIGGGKGKNDYATNGSVVDGSLFIKSGDASANSSTFKFTSSTDTNFNRRYVRILPEVCFKVGDNEYAFFEDAIAAINSSETNIVLIKDATIGESCKLNQAATIKLNNKNFTVLDGKRITGDKITFDIASDKDMETVNTLNNITSKYTEGENKVSHIRVPENQVWNILEDITTKSKIKASRLKSLTINGNGKTLSGAEEASEDPTLTSYIIVFESGTPSGSTTEPNNIVTWGMTVEVKNLKIKTNGKFEKCVYVASNTKKPEKRAIATFTDVSFDNSTSKAPYAGACIVNNWGDVTIKGNCKFITGENSYSAIDLTKTRGDASLTFDNTANAIFTDGRVAVEKVKEPLIGFDVDTEDENYASNTNWTVTGYDNENVGLVVSLRSTKEGYDFPVCEISNVKYGSITKALNTVSDSTQTIIKLIADDTENVTIPSERKITLDLNDHVLKGSGTTSVIVNEGELTVKDSATSKTDRYFTDSNSDGCFEKFETSYNTDEKTEGGDYVKVTGGCITGGSAIWGGGINNAGKFTLAGGNIVGCKADVLAGGSPSGGGGEIASTTGISTYRGGAVYNSNEFVMTGGNIIGCASIEEGGAIFNTAEADLQGGSIKFCSAKHSGGAIYNAKNEGAENNLKVGANIKNCSAKAKGTDTDIGYGGAIYNASGSNLTLTGQIKDCSTTKFGGGVFNKGTLTMEDDAVIESCSAEKGAGVHNDGNTWVSFTMNGGTIKNNTAVKNGGGVQNSENASFNFNGGSITGNNAKESLGGGIFTKGTMTLSGKASISENTSGDSTKVADNLAVVKGFPIALDNYKGKSTGVSVIEKVSGSYIKTTGQFATNANIFDNRHFVSDDDNYCVMFNAGHLELAIPAVKPAEPTQYTVSFDTQGHGTAPAAQTITADGKVKAPATLVADGYVFGGWFKEAECVNAWDFEKDTVTKDTKLYAKWTAEETQPVVAKESCMVMGSTKGSTITIKWNAVEGAEGYDVYFAKCGATYKKAKSTTSLKFTKKGLNTKSVYKCKVKAYKTVDGEKTYIETSSTLHIAGAKAKYSNATKVTVDKTELSMKAGETAKLTAQIAKKSNAKAVLWKGHVSAKIRYMSSDENVATVDENGSVKAVGKGEAYVYAYAANGVYAKVKISVTGDLGAVWIG